MYQKKYRVLYSKRLGIIQSEYRLFEYMTYNDKTTTFSYLNDGYFSIKLQKVIWTYKDKTYNGWNDIGEDLQWEKVCNGGGLQYNIGVLYGQTDFNHKRI